MRAAMRLGRFLKRYRLTIALSLVLLAASGVAELAIPPLVQAVIDAGILKRDMVAILAFAGPIVGFAILAAALAFAGALLSVHISHDAAADLRRELFAHLTSLSCSDLARAPGTRLADCATADVSLVMSFTQVMLRQVARAALLIVGALALLSTTSWQLALIVLGLLGAALVLLYFLAARVRPLLLAARERLAQLGTLWQGNLAGARLVRALRRFGHEAERFEAASENALASATRLDRSLGAPSPFLGLVSGLGLLAAVSFGGWQAIAGQLTPGQVVAAICYVLLATLALASLGPLVGLGPAAEAAARRIVEVLERQPAILDRPDAVPLPALRGQVAFQEVCFSYGGAGGEPALVGINLSAEPGQMVALLGATGSGKTTLLNLIPRFYDVSSGRVLLDGLDVRDATLDSLRSQIGLVAQEAFLFGASASVPTRSVRANICYGRPEASDEEVIAAAQAAQAHAFILSLPQGYDTPIGAPGLTLSPLQRQCLAIARALLVRPRILILDDATAALDAQTSARLLSALASLPWECTRFVVARQRAALLAADRVVILERGQIVAEGPHAALLASSPLYRALYQSLPKGYEEEAAPLPPPPTPDQPGPAGEEQRR